MITASLFTAKVVGTTSIGLWAGYNLSLVHHPAETAVFGRNLWPQCSLTEFTGKGCVGSLFSRWSALVSRAKTCCDERKAAVANKPALSPRLTTSELTKLSVKALHASALSGLALIANFVAYTGARASGKHPYLLYLALGAPLVGMLQYYGARKLFTQGEEVLETENQLQAKQPPTSSSSESQHLDGDVEIVGDLSSSTYEQIKSPNSPSAAPVESGKPGLDETPAFSLESKYSIFSTVVAGLSGFLYVISVIGLAGDTSF